MFLLILYVVGALAISFLCSILEAALLSIREVELEERKAKGDKAAIALLQLKRERIDDAISAILILNTIAHTAGAALAGAQAGKVFGDDAVAIFSAVLIFLVLFFTEIIPKTLGTVHASRLVGFVGNFLRLLIWLLKPVLALTRLLTGFLASHEKKPITRGELAAMVSMATRQGTLQDSDSRLVSNVLRYDEIKIEDVMTPRTVLCALPESSTLEEFLADTNSRVYSRIPLFKGNRDHIVGYFLQREALAAAADGADRSTTLAEFNRPIFSLAEDSPVSKAIRRLTEEQHHLAIIHDEFGGLRGLVTLEDLMETILGIEILDESDKVADLRAEAIRLRDQRLKKRQATTEIAQSAS